MQKQETLNHLNQSQLIKNQNSSVLELHHMKQKRGGSHEEQTRDRMVNLLQKPQQTDTNYHSRCATALANQRAFGQEKRAHVSVNKRGSSNGSDFSNCRSIHQRHEHLNKGQKLKLHEEIMREREKIIKYNKQYMRKYGKFPPTCLDFYKFVKKIGNGAFG